MSDSRGEYEFGFRIVGLTEKQIDRLWYIIIAFAESHGAWVGGGSKPHPLRQGGGMGRSTHE